MYKLLNARISSSLDGRPSRRGERVIMGSLNIYNGCKHFSRPQIEWLSRVARARNMRVFGAYW